MLIGKILLASTSTIENFVFEKLVLCRTLCLFRLACVFVLQCKGQSVTTALINAQWDLNSIGHVT